MKDPLKVVKVKARRDPAYWFSEEYYSKLKICKHCDKHIEPFGWPECLARPMVHEGARSYTQNCEPR